jgi:glycosyltransferase involved in cell wall biosynthesis
MAQSIDGNVTVGVVTTHPIQYQVPLFRELDARDDIDVVVYYGRIPDRKEQGKGFGTSFEWDLPLLQGYSWAVSERQPRQTSGKEVPTFDGFADAYCNVDVMLIHGWNTGYMRRAWWKGIREDVPLLVRGESNSKKPRPWYVRVLHRFCLWPFDRYLYIGQSNKQFYKQAGVSAEALYPALYCVENERFDEDWCSRKEDRSALRTEMGIEDSAVCFLFCGKFIDKKRPTDVVGGFVRAWRGSDRPMHLLMVGDGALRSEAEDLAPPEAPVTFTGFLNQTEIGDAYAAADMLVLPSDYGETWGLVVNEGMVFELPAIVSDRVGCGPDLIDEGETGHTVSFRNVKALASTMTNVAGYPDRVREMGRKARDRVMSEYTIENAADGITKAALDAYRSRQ